ncbi:hypothetical protein HMPREF9587_01515 [Cutibacterium acnes HL025PA1]|nr:hypothetical protein HMPREF9587_01515 [Cutibacterium acnes HL025PA1]
MAELIARAVSAVTAVVEAIHLDDEPAIPHEKIPTAILAIATSTTRLVPGLKRCLAVNAVNVTSPIVALNMITTTTLLSIPTTSTVGSRNTAMVGDVLAAVASVTVKTVASVLTTATPIQNRMCVRTTSLSRARASSTFVTSMPLCALRDIFLAPMMPMSRWL